MGSPVVDAAIHEDVGIVELVTSGLSCLGETEAVSNGLKFASRRARHGGFR